MFLKLFIKRKIEGQLGFLFNASSFSGKTPMWTNAFQDLEDIPGDKVRTAALTPTCEPFGT
jgi:hypothetical protein